MPASVKLATIVEGVPSASGTVGPVTPPDGITGATLVTSMVFLSVAVPPVFVTARVTTYVPLSSGVKLRLVPGPAAKAIPFFVTPQTYASVPVPDTVLVRLIAVPSGLLAGAPPMLTVGGTSTTVTVLLSMPEAWS